MTVDTEAIIRLLTDIAGDKNIQVTVKQALKGACITGVSSFIGGVLLGPVGFAVGGAGGGILAAFTTGGTFKSVREVLHDLPFEQKRVIAVEIQSILDRLEISDLAEFARIAIMVGTVAQQSSLETALVNRFLQESITVIQRQVMAHNTALN